MADTTLKLESNRHENYARNDVTSQELSVSCMNYAKMVAFLLFLGSAFYHALLHNAPGMCFNSLASKLKPKSCVLSPLIVMKYSSILSIKNVLSFLHLTKTAIWTLARLYNPLSAKYLVK